MIDANAQLDLFQRYDGGRNNYRGYQVDGLPGYGSVPGVIVQVYRFPFVCATICFEIEK